MYLDFAVADSAFKAPGDRTLGDRTIIPAPTTQLGRLEIGTAPGCAALLGRAAVLLHDEDDWCR